VITVLKSLHYNRVRNTFNFFAGVFQQYDHGSDLNLKYYGTPEPPRYNLTAVTVPISLHVGDADTLISYQVCFLQLLLSGH
jgi:hypothetical protein